MTRLALPLVLLVCASAARAAEGGQLDGSRTLFSVMAALNAAGFDAQASSPANHPLRAAVRKWSEQQKLPVVAELRTFLYEHRKADPGADLAQYVSFALVSGDPPDFLPRLQGTEVPPDVQTLAGFRELLVRFDREAKLDEAWSQVQGEYDKAIARYSEPVNRAVLEANGYLRNPTSGYMGRRFQVYIDLLAPPNQVHTRSYKDEYFVVVTPSADLRTDDIRHAYLHYLLDPLATKYAESVMRLRGLRDYAEGAPALDESYKADFLLLTTESLIKAVEARLSRKPAMVSEALAEGFVLTPFFAESLPAYEKGETAMRLHFPEMLAAADLRKEDRRLRQVKFAEAKAVRAAPRIDPPVAPANPSDGAMEAADKLYAARDLEKAREAYLAIVRATADRQTHTRAYFGLARVAALRNEPDLAEQLFRKTLEGEPDSYTRAWSEVYLGRLAEGFGEKDKAAERYKAALAVEGAPPGARQAAEQGLQKVVPR